MNNCPQWLKTCVIYSLYPQSFYDSNGDGIGDLPGITEKLAYIKDLGCTAIWMNPIFESDFLDAGYDVKDFYKIAPRYGTEDDLVALCKKAHEMGLKVMLDLVAGHTSDQCPWFLESAGSEDNANADRYIWAPEKPPKEEKFKENASGRPGWFMYNYYDIQPALNYGFAEVTEPWQLSVDHPVAMENQNELIRILDYWFRRGVDGFRVDMASSLIKNDPDKRECMRLWRRIRRWMDENYPDNVLISEWSMPSQAIPAGFHIDMLIHNTNRCLTTLFRHEHFAHKVGDKMFGESYFRKEALGNYEDFLEEYLPFYEKTKDLGFSESDAPYLPVDPALDAPTVEGQKDDADSILNYVKALIALRKAHPALWADGEYRTVESGYPLVFERKSGNETVRVILNPSAQGKTYGDPSISQVLFCHNARAEGARIHLGSRSCLIYTV